MFCLEVLHKLMKEISISICKHECTYLMLGFFLSLIFRNFVTWVAFIQLQFLYILSCNEWLSKFKRHID